MCYSVAETAGANAGKPERNHKDGGRLKYQRRYDALAKPLETRASLVTKPRIKISIRGTFIDWGIASP